MIMYGSIEYCTKEKIDALLYCTEEESRSTIRPNNNEARDECRSITVCVSFAANCGRAGAVLFQLMWWKGPHQMRIQGRKLVGFEPIKDGSFEKTPRRNIELQYFLT